MNARAQRRIMSEFFVPTEEPAAPTHEVICRDAWAEHEQIVEHTYESFYLGSTPPSMRGCRRYRVIVFSSDQACAVDLRNGLGFRDRVLDQGRREPWASLLYVMQKQLVHEKNPARRNVLRDAITDHRRHIVEVALYYVTYFTAEKFGREGWVRDREQILNRPSHLMAFVPIKLRLLLYKKLKRNGRHWY